MSLDFYFYVESRASGEWKVPDAFTPPDAPLHRRVEAFAWIKGSSGAGGLFVSPNAPIPFRPEHPPAWESSALCQWMRPDLWAGEPDTPVIAWLPYAELMADLWDETRLTIGGSVPAPHAALFGDGTGPFPESALLEAGMYENDVRRLLGRGKPVAAPVDRSFGHARNEIEAHHSHHPLEVTWRATIADHLGRERADAFRSLRRFGDDADLRVISTFC
jgi:hypothetical protein